MRSPTEEPSISRPVPADAEEVHLRDYLLVVRKRRWLIASLWVVIVATAAIGTYLQTPIYRATARVLIDPEPPKVLAVQEVVTADAQTQDYYRTQYELIKGRPVLEKVIETLNLQERLPALAEAKDPVRAVQASLTVEPKRNTRLVDIQFEDPDPGLAAEVTNAIAHTYVRQNLERKIKGAREALVWLAEQMSMLKAKVQDSALALQKYRERVGIVGLEQQRQITAQKIMDFNRAYLDSQAQRLAVEAKLQELQTIARDPRGAQTIFTVAGSPLLQKLKAEASDLEVQLSKALQTYKEKHPEIVKLRAQMQQVDKKIGAEIQTMIRAVETESKVAKAREQALLRNVQALQREGMELNEKEIQYLALQGEAESNQQMHDIVLKRLKETGVAGGLETNNIQVVEEAQVPHTPAKPRVRLNLLLGVVVGLFASVGLAFFLEYLDTSIKTPDEVERYLGLPVLGIVPLFGEKR